MRRPVISDLPTAMPAAIEHRERRRPQLFVFFGMIASGKSTLALAFAGRRGFPCHNTDLVRKELAGVSATTRCVEGVGEGIYSPAFSARTYQALLDRAERDLANGMEGVVLDGSYGRRTDRARVLELAARLGVAVVFVLCTCSDREVRRRLELRARDPRAVSDGRWEIYLAQKEHFEPPDELPPEQLVRIDTEAPPGVLLARLEDELSNRGL